MKQKVQSCSELIIVHGPGTGAASNKSNRPSLSAVTNELQINLQEGERGDLQLQDSAQALLAESRKATCLEEAADVGEDVGDLGEVVQVQSDLGKVLPRILHACTRVIIYTTS